MSVQRIDLLGTFGASPFLRFLETLQKLYVKAIVALKNLPTDIYEALQVIQTQLQVTLIKSNGINGSLPIFS